jgi:hypothetical protein
VVTCCVVLLVVVVVAYIGTTVTCIMYDGLLFTYRSAAV